MHKHRHLVAVPFFLSVVGLSFVPTFFDIPTALSSMRSTVSTTDEERFSFSSGLYGVVYAGRIEQKDDALLLHEGSALIASKGIIHVKVDDTALTAFDGVIHITRSGDMLTIAAISSPVSVQHGEQRMVVPALMQWRFDTQEGITPLNDGFSDWMQDRTPSMLPMNFIERKQQDLSLVQEPDLPLPDTRAELPGETNVALNLLLPVAKQQVLSRRREQALGALRFAVEQGDSNRITELLQDELLQSALTTPRGQQVVAFLLSSTPKDQTAERMQLLERLVQSEAVWAALSLHPQYAEITWSVFGPEVSVESQLARVFLLPFGALDDAFPPFVLERYKATLGGMLDHVSDKVAFTEHLLEAHVPLVVLLNAKEYPQRARLLRDTLLFLIDEADEQTDAMRNARTLLHQFDDIDVSMLPLTEKKPEEAQQEQEVPQSKSEPEVVLVPEQVEATAYDMLTDAGALFSVQTAVAAFAPNQARVSDILFSAPTEDRTVSFTLNVLTGMVSDIELNGETNFPYTPTFDGFVNWISR